MLALRRRQGTRFDFEFLKRIREGQRQAQIVIRIVVLRAVQSIVHTARKSTAERDRQLALHASRRRCVFRNVDGGADGQDQLGCVTSIQRQFQNALCLHGLSDTHSAGLHKRSIGLNLDLLRPLAHFERHVNDWVAVDLQHDSCLDKRSESRQRRFQFVRTERQVRQHIHAGFVADRASGDSGLGLCCRDFYARQDRTAGILHGAGDLRG